MHRLLAALGPLAVLALLGWFLRPEPGPSRDGLGATFSARLASAVADPTWMARQSTIEAQLARDDRCRLVPGDPTPLVVLGCDAFTVQPAAQLVLDADPSDPHRLDEDGDRAAGEELPP